MSRAQGIDISKWQGSFDYLGNVDFVIQKASEATSMDYRFLDMVDDVMEAPIRGAYHYFRTEFDAVSQASYFNEVTKGYNFHFLAVDYEAYNNVLDLEGARNLILFINKLQTYTEKPVILYTSPYIYRDNLCNFDDYFKELDCWIAHYNGEDPETGAPDLLGVRPEDEWLYWQWTSEGDGEEFGVGSTYVDRNVFNGNMTQLAYWIAENSPVEPDPEPDHVHPQYALQSAFEGHTHDVSHPVSKGDFDRLAETVNINAEILDKKINQVEMGIRSDMAHDNRVHSDRITEIDESVSNLWLKYHNELSKLPDQISEYDTKLDEHIRWTQEHEHIDPPVEGTFWDRLRWLITGRTAV